MSPELKAAIEKARDHKMTAREKFEQRVSFVYGQQEHDKPGKSKDEIRQMLADSGGWPLAEMDELTTLRSQVSELRADLEAIRNVALVAEDAAHIRQFIASREKARDAKP